MHVRMICRETQKPLENKIHKLGRNWDTTAHTKDLPGHDWYDGSNYKKQEQYWEEQFEIQKILLTLFIYIW